MTDEQAPPEVKEISEGWYTFEPKVISPTQAKDSLDDRGRRVLEDIQNLFATVP